MANPTKWTYKKLQESAGKYQTVKEWRQAEPSAYATASQRGLLKELTDGMTKVITHGYWTKERVIESAKKFDQISSWAKHVPSAYQAARRLGIQAMATRHMERVGNKRLRCIYVIHVSGTNYAYVGLTYNVKRRFRDHLKTRRFKDLADDHGEDSIICEQMTDYIDADLAQIKEEEIRIELLEMGFEVLNKAKTGSLGGVDIKWDHETILENAKQYCSVMEWIRNEKPAYAAAASKGMLLEATQHMEREIARPGSWSKEKIVEITSSFNTINEWITNDKKSYAAATRLDLLTDPDVVGHMERNVVLNRKWTPEKILENALQYQYRAEWKRDSSGAYKAAVSLGLLEKVTEHMVYRPLIGGAAPTWTKEAVLASARRYETKPAWRNADPGAYASARKKGWLLEATKHMVVLNPKGKWSNREAVLEDALNYKTKSEWQKHSVGAYEAAKRLQCFDTATAHMTELRRQLSKKEIFTIAKTYDSRGAWKVGDAGSYQKARKNGWLDEASSHMKKRK